MWCIPEIDVMHRVERAFAPLAVLPAGYPVTACRANMSRPSMDFAGYVSALIQWLRGDHTAPGACCGRPTRYRRILSTAVPR